LGPPISRRCQYGRENPEFGVGPERGKPRGRSFSFRPRQVRGPGPRGRSGAQGSELQFSPSPGQRRAIGGSFRARARVKYVDAWTSALEFELKL
jgi:hypothetical protein